MKPKLSPHFKSRQPSSIRLAQLEYAKRHDGVKAINLAIGNVSLPMHPAMKSKMLMLQTSRLKDGIVKYSPTAGFKKTKETFLYLIESSGFNSSGLYCQVTDGGSAAMELAILGTCSSDRPLMIIEPAYANYRQFAQRVGVPVISISRKLNNKGEFEMPEMKKIEKMIEKNNPGAIVVVPYDNPTGQLYSKKVMLDLASLCVENDLWMISDEAYRELYYEGDKVSIWGIDNRQIAGFEGRRISIETSSKVFNACGLRVGALVTDSAEFHQQAVAEYTANLSANTIGQVVFLSLLDQSAEELNLWYKKQQEYYRELADIIYVGFKRIEPSLIVSNPQAAIYSVIDVKNIVDKTFSADDFVLWAARQGKFEIDGQELTLLLAPMSGFYSQDNLEQARTQMRLAYVEDSATMKVVPELFMGLLKKYLAS